MRFSDRAGATKPRTLVQLESINEDLRYALWNVYFRRIFGTKSGGWLSNDPRLQQRLRLAWEFYFKRPLDHMPADVEENVDIVSGLFTQGYWWEVYNFLEFTVDFMFGQLEINEQVDFADAINSAFEREMSGYRFIQGVLAPISSPEEVDAVSEAATVTPVAGARSHITSALEKLAAKPDPDYPNAIKEAISAVESMARVLTGKKKATLGDALKVMEDHTAIHPALKSAFSTLYGYTSDEGGIRHGAIGESKVSYEEAKFMIVSCSAFVNYLVGRAAASGIDLSADN